jgi:hypothetical protein
VSAWQRDWKSRSYVELIRHAVNLQGVKIREVRGYDKSKLEIFAYLREVLVDRSSCTCFGVSLETRRRGRQIVLKAWSDPNTEVPPPPHRCRPMTAAASETPGRKLLGACCVLCSVS